VLPPKDNAFSFGPKSRRAWKLQRGVRMVDNLLQIGPKLSNRRGTLYRLNQGVTQSCAEGTRSRKRTTIGPSNQKTVVGCKSGFRCSTTELPAFRPGGIRTPDHPVNSGNRQSSGPSALNSAANVECLWGDFLRITQKRRLAGTGLYTEPV
jgi:hypothetical protein